MNYTDRDLRTGTPKRGWRKLDWSVKAPVLVAAAVLGALDKSPYWGRSVLMAAMALIVPVAGFRDLWSEVRFWVTVTVAALFQIPVLMALQPIGRRSGVAFMLGFTVADGLLIIAMICWACLRHEN
jgi:hypothetical protein